MKKLWLLIGSAILAFSLAGCGSNDSAKEASVSAKDSTQEKNKEYQDLVLQFEKELLEVDNLAKGAQENYMEVADKVTKNQASIYDAYEAASKSKKASEATRQEANKLNVPDKLPKEVAKKLKEAKEELALAYSFRSDGMGYTMEFLDNNKPSSIEKANESFGMESQCMARSVINLEEAKKQVGIQSSAQ